MAILKFDNKAAYDAAAKSTTESTVALIRDGEGIKYNGVNVIVDIPEVGDILFLDANNAKHFLKHDTYVAASFPAGCTFVGVVFDIQGNTAKILNKTTTSQKWADVFQWKVTGWVLDSTDHAGTVTLNNTSFGTFTYNAATLSDCATQLNSWLAANASNYTCYLQGSDIILQWNAYTAYPGTHAIVGLTLTPTMGDEVLASSGLTRKSGVRIYWGVSNYLRYLEYYNTNGSIPTSMVSDNTDIAISRTYFNTGEFAANMRTKYGTFENYVASMIVQNPYPRGILDGKSGLVNTLALANVTYTAANGSTQYKYPAARYCNQISYNNADMAQGKWYLPSISELSRLFEQLTYGLSGLTIAQSDVINRSLNAIGGSLQGVSSVRWSSSRYSSFNAWNSYNTGLVSYYNFFYALIAAPVLALKFNS